MHMHMQIAHVHAHVHAHSCTCMHMDGSSTRALHRGTHMHMHTHIAHVHAHACTCMHMDSSSTRALHRGLHMHMPMPCILPLGFGPVVPPPHRFPAAPNPAAPTPAAPTPATPNPPPLQPSATPSPATPIPLQWLHWINGFNGSSNDYRLSINVYSSRVRPCAHPCTPSRSKSTSTASHCVLRQVAHVHSCACANSRRGFFALPTVNVYHGSSRRSSPSLPSSPLDPSHLLPLHIPHLT